MSVEYSDLEQIVEHLMDGNQISVAHADAFLAGLRAEQKLERITKRLEEKKVDATYRKNTAAQTGVEWAEEAAINQLYVVEELLKELQS
jgi:hypothetical protein